jgi:transporter family protein
MNFAFSWQGFALLSAAFAAMTALLGKVGVSHINSNLATLIRTVVIFAVTALLVTAKSEWQKPTAMSWIGWVCLIASGVTTGLSWLCYFRALQLGPVSMVAPIDKMSVALVMVAGWALLGEQMTAKGLLGGGFVVLGTLILIL